MILKQIPGLAGYMAGEDGKIYSLYRLRAADFSGRDLASHK
jgi:hypothetical protein